MRRLLLLTALLSVPAMASPKEVSLILGGWSYHPSSLRYTERSAYCIKGKCEQEFNGDNKALGIKWGDFSLVTFDNSYYTRSYAAYYTYQPDMLQSKYINLGVRLGAATGYSEVQVSLLNTFTPMISPVAQLKPFADCKILQGISLDYGLLPSKSGLVHTLNFKYTI